ncbi:MFS transporter [Streptomyces sp900105245]|uniref:MFS transporter n=1 Tax=Streptomyces sp. 900105245 TaxID=3154379 RepID=UPI00332AB489
MAHAQIAPTSRTTGARPAFPAPEARPAAPPSFTAVLRQRHCARLLIASVAGRLPLGMVPVALILAAQRYGHSLATASVLAALYGVSPALGLPLLGRLADRGGLPLRCHLGAVGVAVALSALAVGAPPVFPSRPCARLWPVSGARRWRAACARCGPPCCRMPGTCAPPTRWMPPPRRSSTSQAPPSPSPWPPGSPRLRPSPWRPPPPWPAPSSSPPRVPPGPGARRPAGGTRWACCGRPPCALLLCALVFLGGTVGALDVAAIAVAGRQDAAWLAGALPAVFSAAGLLGGILFTRLQPATAPQPRHLLLVAALFAAGWLPLLAPLPAPAVLAAAVLPGALFVPLLTVASLALTALAPAGTSTEAVGWMSSAMRLGLAGGTALAGPLGGHFALPLLAAALCALLLWAPTPSAAAPAAA